MTPDESRHFALYTRQAGQIDDSLLSLFPNDFLWGAATSAHQVEGGPNNQWTEWERDHAHRLAQTAATRLGHMPAWPALRVAMEDPANYLSGGGTGHFENYEQDFHLLSSLHLNAFRFSIEWSRLEPKEGEWDQTACAHYQSYIAALHARGITPVVSLWHWTMPIWFAHKGGFAKRRNLVYWRRYVERVLQAIDLNGVQYICTINEPNVYSGNSYITGEWPPQQRSYLAGLNVYHNLVRAHRQAYRLIKRSYPDVLVGVAMQCNLVRPARPHVISDRLMAWGQAYVWNWWFLDRIRRTQDFVGLNYYFTDIRKGFSLLPKNPSEPVNDLGWYMNPAGIEEVLVEIWRRYRRPVLITENGTADHTDTYRPWWIQETITAMARALKRGVPLRGYLHWSLLDNFEWAYGWWPKFGLCGVDLATMRRQPTSSARLLKKYLKRIESLTREP